MRKGIYEDDKGFLFEVLEILYHWETRNQLSSKNFIKFISYGTGNIYVIEQSKFLKEFALWEEF